MKRTAAWTFLVQTGVASAAFIVNIVAARELGPEGRGSAYLAVMVPSLLALFATAGLSNSFVRFVAEDVNEASAARGVLNWAVAFAAVASMPVAYFADPLSSWIGLDDPLLVRLALPIFSLQTYQTLAGFLLLGLGRLGRRNSIVVAQGASYVVIAPALLALMPEPSALVVAVGCSYGVSCAAALVALRDVRAPWSYRRLAPILRRYAGFGSRGQVGQLAQYLNYRLDAMILGGLAGPRAVGAYAVATSVAEVVTYISNAAATVAFPRFAQTDSLSSVSRTVRLTLFSATAVGLCVASAGAVAIPLVYGPSFSDSVAPFLLLIPGTVALAIVKMLSAFFVAKGRPGQMTTATLLSLGVTVTLDVVLIPPFGPIGAAIASTGAYIVGAVACLWLFRSSFGGDITLMLRPRVEDLRSVLSLRRGKH